MAYPAASTAVSGAENSFWFYVERPTGLRVCMTQGKSFVKRLQTILRTYYNYTSMPVHGVWDRNVNEALASLARSFSTSLLGVDPDRGGGSIRAEGYARKADRLLDESRRQIVSHEAVFFAIWVAYLSRTDNMPDSVQIAPHTVLPRWGADLGDDHAFVQPGWGALCWDKAAVDADLADQAAFLAIPPAPVTPAPGTPPRAASTPRPATPTPLRPRIATVAVGDNPALELKPLSALEPEPSEGPSATSVLLIGTGIVAAGLLYYTFTRPAPRPVRAPQRAR